jgi:hypothetical protein
VASIGNHIERFYNTESVDTRTLGYVSPITGSLFSSREVAHDRAASEPSTLVPAASGPRFPPRLPPCGDSGTKATRVVSSTAISSSVSSEAPLIVAFTSAGADTDAGSQRRHEDPLRSACPPYCRFQGCVRIGARRGSRAGDQPIDPHDGLTRATEVVLDKVALECASMQLWEAFNKGITEAA